MNFELRNNELINSDLVFFTSYQQKLENLTSINKKMTNEW